MEQNFYFNVFAFLIIFLIITNLIFINLKFFVIQVKLLFFFIPNKEDIPSFKYFYIFIVFKLYNNFLQCNLDNNVFIGDNFLK